MSSATTLAGSSRLFGLSLDERSDEELMTAALLLQHSEEEVKHARLAVEACLASREMGLPRNQEVMVRWAKSADFAATAVEMRFVINKEQTFTSCIKLADPMAVRRDIDLALLENDQLQAPLAADVDEAKPQAVQAKGAAESEERDDNDGGRDVDCFQCGTKMREFTRTMNPLCGTCNARFGSIDAGIYSNEARKERDARLNAKEAAEEQPAKIIAPLTEAEKEVFVYVNNDKHGCLWNELCDKLKTARDGINYPPDFYEQISMGQATRDYERANYPLVAAFEDHGFGSNEHYNLCKALGGTQIGTHHKFFPGLKAEGLVDAQGNATQAFKDQAAGRMTFKNKNAERELEAAARFAAKEAKEDQRKAVKEVAAAETAAQEATPKKRERELPRDSEAPGAPVKRAR